MNNLVSSLTVLRKLGKNPLFAALSGACESSDGEEREQKFNDFLYEIYRAEAEESLFSYLSELILTDENAFSVACASQRTPSEYLQNAYLEDLKAICAAPSSLPIRGFSLGELSPLLCGDGRNVLKKLREFYAVNGYGIYIHNKAFAFDGNAPVPVASPVPTTLDQLKNYAEEKRLIGSNISDFVSGLPFSHMLLYGDKGTGKSSTVHAMLNRFSSQGLRMIEIGKDRLEKLSALRRDLSANPLKFILFIDDLSLEESDKNLSALKTALEGSLSQAYGNTMIVATSNRRHIVKERFAERNESVHPSDSIDEQLSLSDRFGLTVNFASVDRENYLSIVSQLADDRHLAADRQTLAALAERWAIVKGGRSPRRAKQFVDLVYACEADGRPVEF